MRHDVGGNAPTGGQAICFRVPLGEGVRGVGMGRCPRDGDGIVAFHLIEEDIDPGDDALVGDRLDGPSGKEFHTVHAVGDDVVARGGVRRQVPAPLLDPVEGIVHCTEFAGVARGVPSAKPIRVGGGRGHGSPDRPGGGCTRGGDVDTPASRSGREGRAVSEEESERSIEPRVPRTRGLGHIFLGLLPGGESLHVSRDPDRLRLGFTPGCINAGDMTEANSIEHCGGGGRGSVTLETPAL